jgi:aminoglycoside phosphotransferase family enzyme/predicted kinase
MELKRLLLRPQAYPGFAPARVELIETHLSWVFLLERDVFKVKKPVELGFVDFRSLEQRKAACEAEVELNRRLAPNVYIGVVPIVKNGEGVVLASEGVALEWAVHMRRLPDAGRADLLLNAGTLAHELIDRLAETIALFHRTARCDADTARFGQPATIRHNVFENFTQTAEGLRELMSENEAEELTAFQTWFLSAHAALFGERVERGFVRDGHGDLRLEHVYFEREGAPTIIDCIEFNERFRFADVCADIAFLSMDLAVHGQPVLAERLLARYARASNDFDLYALIDFYESYRAFVRGKVALMLAADSGVEDSARVRAREDARRYFLFALAAGRPQMVPPFLLAVCGLVASGKSTVADALAERIGAVVISSDRTRKHLLGVPAEQSLAEQAFTGAYSSERSQELYAELMRRASVVLASGRAVIVDASFRSAGQRAQLRSLARQHDVPLLFAECRCREETARERLRARANKPNVSDARLELFADFARNFEPVTEFPADQHMVIDTERPLAHALSALELRLGLPKSSRVSAT